MDLCGARLNERGCFRPISGESLHANTQGRNDTIRHTQGPLTVLVKPHVNFHVNFMENGT